MTLAMKEPATGKKEPEFAPIDLDGSPEVEDFLDRLGLGRFVRDDLVSPAGRNAVWIGRTTTGRRVFVKRLLGEDRDTRLGRLTSFQRFADTDRFPVPDLLGHDTDTGIVVYEAVAAAHGGAELMVDEEFTTDISRRVGNALGTVHSAPVSPDAEIDTSPSVFPSTVLLTALPSALFETLSFAEVQAWRLLQQDAPLAEAVHRLREREALAPRTPVHGDFRMDQLLISDDRVHIADWEEFRLGDAARDVGAFAGEWLYRCILDIVTDRGGQPPIVDDISHEEILARGMAGIERVSPVVNAFWRGYRGVRPEVDAEFVERATAFAGWHTIDRLLAGAARRTKLTGIERAAAGVGRSALITPDRFGAVLGFEEIG
ncbi:class V lanthionine synthetase subunit LxmK [Nocardiopsis sp. N85]|uniref:class V lanthionine synthetase subunit LxmK n=1 Tax=Nocardiopsis sp. N85 TaxID=3029400 RepID=UPI00237F4C3A|nr:class V lanthionine synthetase subunit LxmK [Nocardiopsis sp. N85]MDE3723099.1 class V lanthionine synthetase subunit LxmK [Nocardiopsis sp. N85]